MIEKGVVDTFVREPIGTQYDRVSPSLLAEACGEIKFSRSQLKQLIITCEERIRGLMQAQLQGNRRFYWPDVGTFWLEENNNRYCQDRFSKKAFRMPTHNRIRFSACRNLRRLLRQGKDDSHFSFGGEKNPWQQLHYWIECFYYCFFNWKNKFFY